MAIEWHKQNNLSTIHHYHFCWKVSVYRIFLRQGHLNPDPYIKSYFYTVCFHEVTGHLTTFALVQTQPRMQNVSEITNEGQLHEVLERGSLRTEGHFTGHGNRHPKVE